MLWLWLPLAAAASVAEIHTGALAAGCVAVAALAAGILGRLGAPPAAQAAAFLAVGVLLVSVVRPLIVRQRVHRIHTPEMLIGKPGMVIEATDEYLASGRVTVEGASYVARCAPGIGPLPVGTMVRIRGLDSGELVVSRL